MTNEQIAKRFIELVADETDEYKAQKLRESFERTAASSPNLEWQVVRAFLLIDWRVNEDSDWVRTAVGLIRAGHFDAAGE